MTKKIAPNNLNCPESISTEKKLEDKLQDKPLTFQKAPNGKIIPHQSLEKNQAFHSLKKTTGTDQPNLQKHLLLQATNATSISAPKENIYNTTAETLFALDSTTELEGMLAVQLASLHNQAMTSMTRSSKLLIDGAPSELIDKTINRSCKLLNTFYKGVQVREKLKSKGQNIRVEHVHVNEGGQAIIVNVDKK